MITRPKLLRLAALDRTLTYEDLPNNPVDRCILRLIARGMTISQISPIVGLSRGTLVDRIAGWSYTYLDEYTSDLPCRMYSALLTELATVLRGAQR